MNYGMSSDPNCMFCLYQATSALGEFLNHELGAMSGALTISCLMVWPNICTTCIILKYYALSMLFEILFSVYAR